jgi:predicted phosphohydrolase
MKVAVCSDLHVGLTRPEKVADLARRAVDEGTDVFVLAGDIGEPLGNFKRALDLFASHAGRVAVLAGNHDLWSRGISSRELWEQHLPAAARQRDFTWLEWGNVVRDGVAIVGSIGWYDYSARAPGFANKTPEDFFRTKHAYNNDGTFIDWPWTDVEFADRVGDGLCLRLQQAEADPAVRHILLVTHMPVFPAQKVHVKQWNSAGDAYYGNWTLGRRVEGFRKLRMVVSGHTHLGKLAVHTAPDGRKIAAVVVGSDYDKPAYHLVDTATFDR